MRETSARGYHSHTGEDLSILGASMPNYPSMLNVCREEKAPMGMGSDRYSWTSAAAFIKRVTRFWFIVSSRYRTYSGFQLVESRFWSVAYRLALYVIY